MLDIFYFTKSRIDVSALASIAADLGCAYELIPGKGGDILNVCYSDERVVNWMPLEPLGRDFFTFEPPVQERLRNYAPMSGFIISYHIPSTNDVITMLKRVLERYGGWVGLDDNEFAHVYERDNIEHIVHQT